MIVTNPHPAPPDARAVVEPVAGDVFKVTVPVPFRGLRNVNAYLLRGPEGWDVVDTGLTTPAALAAWEAAWTHLGITFADLHQIIVTHHHPDHMGLAGRFQQAAQEAGGRAVPVRMSAREQEIIDIIWHQREARDAVMLDYFTRCGLPDPAVSTFSTQETEGLRRALLPFAETGAALVPGETVQIGARTFEIRLTPGHSDGHLVFYDPADRLLLAGDHVLPHITPNISLWPGAEYDPLGRYLRSLDALRALEVRLALPGHGAVIADWQERLGQLAAHHAERLDAMRHAVGVGATVFDVTRQVFNAETLDRHETRMAVSETLAHLAHLVDRGRLRRRDDEAWWYETV